MVSLHWFHHLSGNAAAYHPLHALLADLRSIWCQRHGRLADQRWNVAKRLDARCRKWRAFRAANNKHI